MEKQTHAHKHTQKLHILEETQHDVVRGFSAKRFRSSAATRRVCLVLLNSTGTKESSGLKYQGPGLRLKHLSQRNLSLTDYVTADLYPYIHFLSFITSRRSTSFSRGLRFFGGAYMISSEAKMKEVGVR